MTTLPGDALVVNVAGLLGEAPGSQRDVAVDVVDQVAQEGRHVQPVEKNRDRLDDERPAAEWLHVEARPTQRRQQPLQRGGLGRGDLDRVRHHQRLDLDGPGAARGLVEKLEVEDFFVRGVLVDDQHAERNGLGQDVGIADLSQGARRRGRGLDPGDQAGLLEGLRLGIRNFLRKILSI
jgi:hypothetical protein